MGHDFLKNYPFWAKKIPIITANAKKNLFVVSTSKMILL